MVYVFGYMCEKVTCIYMYMYLYVKESVYTNRLCYWLDCRWAVRWARLLSLVISAATLYYQSPAPMTPRMPTSMPQVRHICIETSNVCSIIIWHHPVGVEYGGKGGVKGNETLRLCTLPLPLSLYS